MKKSVTFSIDDNLLDPYNDRIKIENQKRDKVKEPRELNASSITQEFMQYFIINGRIKKNW